MAIFDRMRERMRGQRPVGAAQGMVQSPTGGMPGMGQGTGMPGQMPGGMPGGGMQDPFAKGPQGNYGLTPGMAGTQEMRDRYAMYGGATEEDLDEMEHGRSQEAEDAFTLGQRMGAESLMEMAGITPLRKKEMTEEDRLMNRQRLNSATNTLLRYRGGKSSVNRRVIAAQNWWKLNNWQEIRKKRGTKGTTLNPSNTGWLWNCIVGKHADAIDSFPEPVILPRMMDDQEEARKLSKIIPVVMEMNDFEETYNDAMWQKMQEGTGVYGIFWDNSKLNGLGDISIRKGNILNLYWEPGITDIQESRNLFYVSLEDKKELEQQYPELEGKLNTTKISIDEYKTDDSIDTSNKAAVVDWYYKKRDESGRTVLHYCKYVNESCLYSSEEDGLTEGYYADGQYPFVLDPLFPVEGSPAGYGYIDIAKDTQSDIDTLSQAMVKNAAMRATPRYFERKDGAINEMEFMDWSKPIVHVNGTLGDDTVKPIQVEMMGSDVHNMLQQKIDEIKFITGNTDVNNGGVPAGVTAASAIAALKEDSGRSSKDSTKAAYRAYRKIVNMVIERIRQFYDIPRQFRIIGQDGQEEFVQYDNAMLQTQEMPNMPGQEPGMRMPVFDIEVRAQRESAYTKMSQNELALQFWNIGALNPQMTDQALILLDMMDFRGKDELMRKIQAQGTMQETLMKVGQMALMLAAKYEPDVAEELAGMLQGVMAEAGMQPAGGGGAQETQPKPIPDDASDAVPEVKENGIVRAARERAANASRPS